MISKIKLSFFSLLLVAIFSCGSDSAVSETESIGKNSNVAPGLANSSESERKGAKGRKKGKGEEIARVSRPAGDLVGPGRWAPRTRAEDPRTLAYLVDTPEGR